MASTKQLAARIDRFLQSQGSPLAGQGINFVRSGRRYGVDPLLLVAISGQESSFGKNSYRPHNAWGWGGMTFDSWAEGIETVARGLRSGYLDDGLTTIAAIGARYAPIGAGNDPTNLNQHWVSGVTKYYQQLGGTKVAGPRDQGPSSPGIVAPLPTKMPGSSAFLYVDAEGAPDANGVRHHGAVDWFAPGGTPVVSPVAGTVVEVTTASQVAASSSNPGQVFGGVVKIQMADGRVWVFRHVDPRGVEKGQTIAAGESFATVYDGPTATHAHIELWKTLEGGYRIGNMIDPWKVLSGAEPLESSVPVDAPSINDQLPVPAAPTVTGPNVPLPRPAEPSAPAPLTFPGVEPIQAPTEEPDPIQTWQLISARPDASPEARQIASMLDLKL